MKRQSEYHTEQELRLIEKWDVKEVFTLIDYIEQRWWSADWGFKKQWSKESIHNKPIIILELHTGGWSGNEDIINALLKNKMFVILWYSEWRRSGHYKCEIDPANIGFKSANEIAKELDISRQAIHKSNEYEKLKISDRCFLFRKILQK